MAPGAVSVWPAGSVEPEGWSPYIVAVRSTPSFRPILALAGLLALGCGGGDAPATTRVASRGTTDSLTPAALEAAGQAPVADSSALALLTAALADGRQPIADRAAWWLARRGPAGITPLVAALDDPLPAVRRVAAYGLGSLGAEAAPTIQPLAHLLADPSDSVAAMADWALQAIGPAAATPFVTVVRALRFGEVPIRVRAATDLGRLNAEPRRVTPHLLRAFADPDESVSLAAGRALVNLGPAGETLLNAALMGPDLRLRQRAERLLGHSATGGF